MKRTLVGYVVAYAAFEGTAQLAGSLDLAWRQVIIAVAGIDAAIVIETCQGAPRRQLGPLVRRLRQCWRL